MVCCRQNNPLFSPDKGHTTLEKITCLCTHISSKSHFLSLIIAYFFPTFATCNLHYQFLLVCHLATIGNDQVQRCSLIGIYMKVYTYAYCCVLKLIYILLLKMPSRIVFVLLYILPGWKYIYSLRYQRILVQTMWRAKAQLCTNISLLKRKFKQFCRNNFTNTDGRFMLTLIRIMTWQPRVEIKI